MYSQHEEQQYIVEACAGYAPGRFLDIGAFHPKTFSNTRALFELGWSGVMIEPSPQPMLNLLAEYGDEPRITLVSGAVTCEPGLTKLRITDDAVSTSSEAEYEKWKDHAKFIGSLLTPGIPLEYISLRFGGFDFINVDAEGISVDLFLGIMKLGWEPKCFCVEHDSRESEIIQAATAKRYQVTYGNATNMVLVRK